MASRLDACCSRIDTAVRMNQVSAGMKGVVRGMDKSLASMNIEQLSKVMDKFESQFEDLDVKVRVFVFEPCVLWASVRITFTASLVNGREGRVAFVPC